MVTSAKLLDEAYRAEKDADVRERLLLVRRVRVDNEEAASVAENEFHKFETHGLANTRFLCYGQSFELNKSDTITEFQFVDDSECNISHLEL